MEDQDDLHLNRCAAYGSAAAPAWSGKLFPTSAALSLRPDAAGLGPQFHGPEVIALCPVPRVPRA